MKQDWTEQLRKQLADYEMPAPQGLWNDIDAALQQRSRRARIVSLRRRLAAAAAVLVLLSSGVAWLFLSKAGQLERQVAVAPTAAPSDSQQLSLSPQSLVEKAAERLTAMQEEVQASEKAGNRKAQTAKTDSQVAQVELVESESPVNTEMPENVETTVKTESSQQSTKQPVETAQPAPRRKHFMSIPHRQKQQQSLTASLYGSNLMANNTLNNNSFVASMWGTRGMNVTDMDEEFGQYQVNGDVNLLGVSQEVDHKQPLSFGLTVSYPLADRLWIETGLVYTYLQSTFTVVTRNSSAENYRYDQKLHYVGIPLAVGYDIWETGALSLYGVAGLQADVNVSAKVDGQKISKDRIQFSGALHAGAQYRFLPHLGVYVEPGVRTYFDNKSSIQNIYKDKSVQFDLQLGLRYSLE
jgi:hypothetical protein